MRVKDFFVASFKQCFHLADCNVKVYSSGSHVYGSIYIYTNSFNGLICIAFVINAANVVAP